MTVAMDLADRSIGPGAPCLVIAEAGVNHNGDVGVAHALVDVAASAGADAVKFQTFEPARLVSDVAATARYQTSTTGHATQRSMLDTLTLPRGAWAELRDHCTDRGLLFLSTPFDMESARLLAALEVPALKVPSGEATNLPFLRALAAIGLPMLLSTGMCDLVEVAAAVDACSRAPALGLFHCVSAYPTEEAEANLAAIATLRQEFALPTGWSDHTTGAFTAVCAVAGGADLLEKHITLDCAMDGPDHAASEDPEAFAHYVAQVRRAEHVLGDGVKRPQPSELENRQVIRRSWHAREDLVPGTRLTEDHLVALRPATGVDPSVELVGRGVARAVRAGQPIHPDDLVPDGP